MPEASSKATLSPDAPWWYDTAAGVLWLHFEAASISAASEVGSTIFFVFLCCCILTDFYIFLVVL
jgi:hypothetical protein